MAATTSTVMTTRVGACCWMSEEERDLKKKPAQPKKDDNYVRQDVKVEWGATEEECVALQVVTRAQAKKSNKIHPLNHL